MYDVFEIIMTLISTAVISLLLTPIIKRIAFIIGAVDKPDKRRVNTVEMPTIGGVSIYISYFFSLFLLQPLEFSTVFPMFVSATIIVLTGVIDDLKELKPLTKLIGIILAALVVYFYAEIQMTMINIPFIGYLDLGWLSFPITIIWIISLTNAVNLIDGLDGLATGVSAIALTTMGIMGFFFLTFGNVEIAIIVFTLVAACIGFLPYNFYPASIFLGDTGALFLGFMISVISLQGLKNVTIITLIIPIVILGIPITDTLYAILRRKLNKLPISSADKHHMHHRLMDLGFTHRQTVLMIYCLAMIFSIIALLYPISSIVGSIVLTIGLLFGLELFVEIIGLVGKDRRPLVKRMKKIFKKISK